MKLLGEFEKQLPNVRLKLTIRTPRTPAGGDRTISVCSMQPYPPRTWLIVATTRPHMIACIARETKSRRGWAQGPQGVIRIVSQQGRSEVIEPPVNRRPECLAVGHLSRLWPLVMYHNLISLPDLSAGPKRVTIEAHVNPVQFGFLCHTSIDSQWLLQQRHPPLRRSIKAAATAAPTGTARADPPLDAPESKVTQCNSSVCSKDGYLSYIPRSPIPSGTKADRMQ